MADTPAAVPALSPDAQAEADKARMASTARRLIAEITASEKSQAQWLRRARRISKLYRKDAEQRGDKRKFALLWSNTETVRPAIYARPPEPVVSRRYGDADPVGRIASEVLERALKYSIDRQDYDGTLKAASLDFVLIARGQTWERYVPTFGPEVTPQIPLQVKTDGAEDFDTDPDPYFEDESGKQYDPKDVQYGDDEKPFAMGEPYRPVTYEESITDYVNWEDFGHNVARTWGEVDVCWRRTYLSRDQLVDRFGKVIGNKVTLDGGPSNTRPRSVEDEFAKKAAVYEVWVKSEGKVYWISKSFGEAPLDVRDDPLKLDGFFPCPRPLLGTVGNDSLIPTPDYMQYQDQAEEIDDLTAKIAELQKALKVVGFVAGEDFSKVVNLLNASNTTLIAVPDWMKMKESGGVRGAIEWWPIEQVVAALQAMIGQRQQLLNDVYQITGIADVLRGMNDPRATAMAEGIKTQWGTLRIRDRQKEMQRFARDGLRIKAGVIAEKFDIATLKAMTEVEIPTAEEKAGVMQQMVQQAQAAQMQAQAQMAGPQGPMPGGAVPGMQPPPQPDAPPPGPGAPSPMMGHNGGPPTPPQPPQPSDQQMAILVSPTWEDVLGRLRDNALRCFTIDIETDSTVEPNAQEEKAQATELVTAIGNMVAQWGPAIEAQPTLAPMAAEVIKWAMRKFHAGRTLEAIIDSTVDKLVKELQEAKGQQGAQPPADAGKAAAAQAQIQIAAMEQQTAQAELAQRREEAQGKLQVEGANLQIRSQELQLQQGDQQLKYITTQRDPNPQVVN